MDLHQKRRALHLFEKALEMPSAEASAFLDRVCGEGDFAVRREVEALLSADLACANAFLSGSSPGLHTDCPNPEPRPGERLGPYRIVRELGRGGMGLVYLARRTCRWSGAPVALKVLRPDLVRPVYIERFRQERRILAKLRHVHIPAWRDEGVDGAGRPYLAMACIHGQSLRHFFQARGDEPNQRVSLLWAVCRTAAYLHERGVVHRDLKPSNILVDRRGRHWLLDFGAARLLDEADASPAIRQMTLEYASPEQGRGASPAATDDVYALGVMLKVLMAPQDTNAASPVSLNPERLAGLAEIAQTACAEAPGDRYPTAREMALALRRWLEQGRHPASRARPRGGLRPKGPWRAAIQAT